MQQHIDDTTVLNIIVCCSLCSAIACFTMLLRVWSRFQGGRSLIWSDWLVVSSVVSVGMQRRLYSTGDLLTGHRRCFFLHSAQYLRSLQDTALEGTFF